jgi:hypothetical protein
MNASQIFQALGSGQMTRTAGLAALEVLGFDAQSAREVVAVAMDVSDCETVDD